MGNITHDTDSVRAIPIYRKYSVLPLGTWGSEFPTV